MRVHYPVLGDIVLPILIGAFTVLLVPLVLFLIYVLLKNGWEWMYNLHQEVVQPEGVEGASTEGGNNVGSEPKEGRVKPEEGKKRWSKSDIMFWVGVVAVAALVVWVGYYYGADIYHYFVGPAPLATEAQYNALMQEFLDTYGGVVSNIHAPCTLVGGDSLVAEELKAFELLKSLPQEYGLKLFGLAEGEVNCSFQQALLLEGQELNGLIGIIEAHVQGVCDACIEGGDLI